MTDIKIIRFLTNDELIGEIVEDGEKLIVKNPLRILLMPNKADPNNPSVGFVPWMEFSANKEFTLNRDHVITIAEPIAEFINQYKSVFTGLKIPTTKIIMPS